MADEEEVREERRRDSFLRDILDNLDQYAFGIITQHGYRELENKLNAHAKEIERKFHKWFLRGLIVFGVIGLCCALALVGYGVLLSKQGDLLKEFKETRKSFVRDSCEAQNKRHDDTVAKLIKLSDKAIKQAKTDEERKRTFAGRDGSIQLIDALAPKQDCDKLAEVSVGDAKPPPPQVNTKAPKKAP